jgi:hypothetical protein
MHAVVQVGRRVSLLLVQASSPLLPGLILRSVCCLLSLAGVSLADQPLSVVAITLANGVGNAA